MMMWDLDNSGREDAYSITSSVRARADGEIVRHSAFAVLRLITNAYLFVACRSCNCEPRQ